MITRVYTQNENAKKKKKNEKRTGIRGVPLMTIFSIGAKFFYIYIIIQGV